MGRLHRTSYCVCVVMQEGVDTFSSSSAVWRLDALQNVADIETKLNHLCSLHWISEYLLLFLNLMGAALLHKGRSGVCRIRRLFSL